MPVAFAPIVRGSNSLRVTAAGDAYEIELIGSVGKSYWDDSGLTEKEVRDALKSIPAGKPINARINSEGGSVQEGLGIYAAFRERRNDITAHITGYALSIASIFPLGAGRVVSPKASVWMIHQASTWSYGNADDKRQDAAMLDAHDEALADIYAEETGKSKDEIRAAMKAETWIKGADAVEWGLADETDKDETEPQATYRPLAKAFTDRCKMPDAIRNLVTAHAAPPPANSAVPDGRQQQPQQTTKDRMKDKTVALLTKHGIKITGQETEEQLVEMLAQVPVASAAKPQDDTDLRAEIAALKKQRITDKVNTYVDAQKITKAEAAIYVDAALKDEAGTFKILDEKEAPTATATPIGHGAQILSEGEFDRISKLPTAAERYAKLTADWDNIIQDAFLRDARGEKVKGMDRWNTRDRQGRVLNTNTFSSTLTTAFLVDGTVTILQNSLSPLMAFTRDFTMDTYKPMAAHIIEYVSATTAAQTDATDFEGGYGDTIEPASVTMHQYTKNFAVTNAHLQAGLRLQNLVAINAAGMADKIISVAIVPITTTNFGTTAGTTGAGAPLVCASSAFGFSDLQTLWGYLKKSPIKNVILDGEYLARIINNPTWYQTAGAVAGGGWKAFGWDFIGLNTNWTGAGANIVGFACNPQAIGVVAGLPVNPPEGNGNTLQVSTATVPNVGISIASYSWFNAGSRTSFQSFDVMLGAIAIDKTAGTLLKSA